MGAVGIASLCAAVFAVLVVVLLLLAVGRGARARARLDAALTAANAETTELRDRVADLERAAATPQRGTVPAEFLITGIGTDGSQPLKATGVPDRLVLSAAIGEPVVRAVSLVHGVRRALSAESRNRIRFAMRQELRRTRRHRRREMKQAWRRMQARERDPA